MYGIYLKGQCHTDSKPATLVLIKPRLYALLCALYFFFLPDPVKETGTDNAVGDVWIPYRSSGRLSTASNKAQLPTNLIFGRDAESAYQEGVMHISLVSEAIELFLS